MGLGNAEVVQEAHVGVVTHAVCPVNVLVPVCVWDSKYGMCKPPGPRAQSVSLAVETHELPDGVVMPVVRVGRLGKEKTLVALDVVVPPRTLTMLLAIPAASTLEDEEDVVV